MMPWVFRFIANCRNKENMPDLLETDEAKNI